MSLVVTARHWSKAKKPLLALVACTTTLSCAQGKHPFLIVQLCLKDEGGVALFKSEMQALAQHEKLRYVDSSDTTQRNLKIINPEGQNTHADGGLIYIGVEGEDGFGLEAGNLGLNEFEVAVGFADTEPEDASRRFSDRVVAQLKTRWPVSVVPTGRGALPDPKCQ